MKTKKQNIVTIGGGSGQFVLLYGLRDIEKFNTTAIVAMLDSGGSTGRLRDEFGILPPGDILKCILALSPYGDLSRTLLQKRFKKDRRLKGHNAGNMLLTMLSRYTGSFPTGVAALSEILDTKGTILPVTLVKATLCAELTDGTHIYGESAIDIPRGTQREKIRKVFLVPHHSDSINVYPPVTEAIKNAEAIIIGPGDLFTSIIPNLIIPGVKEAIKESKAKILYIVNIMTKFGETQNFTCHDFVSTLEENLSIQIDGLIYNIKKPNQNILKKYKTQKSDFVELYKDNKWWGKRKIFASDLLAVSGDIVRHDSTKLRWLIKEIISS